MIMNHEGLSHDHEPIVACCTARGAGAIALIRVSGTGAVAVVARVARLASGLALDAVASHTIHYGTVNTKEGQPLDSVLFMVMRRPRSFTGQDTVEISTHNNPFIIDAVIEALIKAGARHAEPGEFAKRAVLNNKIDIIQAESINECIHAGTMQGLKVAYAQMAGSLSGKIASLEKHLLHALALSNASFEFIEEEQLSFRDSILALIALITEEVGSLLAQFPLQQQLRQGARIVLIGSVNAGKSSLFNALLGTDRAIVTPIPGTTRDVIEAGVYRAGEHITYSDTAGIRYTDDTIEKEGIERSHAEAQRADMVLIIVDGSRVMSTEEENTYDALVAAYAHKGVLIYTKADLPSATDYVPTQKLPSCVVSTHDATSITRCLELVEQVRQRITKGGGAAPYLLNERHCRLLQTLHAQLRALSADITRGVHYEIMAHHIQDMLATISELTGKSISEAAMDQIFKEFCIGK